MNTLDSPVAAPADLVDIATINGVPLHQADEALSPDELRQRACTELLRQAAIAAGLLPADDPAPVQGATSAAASAAIEALLETALKVPEPSDEACRRYYDANPNRYAIGERLLARHILFAVTPGVDITLLRQRAEACLLQLRCHDTDSESSADESFARAAAELSNCPSAAEGGQLGWLRAEECAPEFARAIFGIRDTGVLPQLVHSRFGLHVVDVQAREPGTVPPFEAVSQAAAQSLRQQAFVTALRQYVTVLAGEADVTGVDLDSVPTPLVQ